MEKLIFVRPKGRKYTKSDDKVIKVDGDIYNDVVKIASEAGISIQKTASTMIAFAANHVTFVDEGEV